MKNVVKNNILLAEFRGWEYRTAEEYDTKEKVFVTPHSQRVWQEASFFSHSEYEWETVKEFLPDELLFHTSWEWLMPVVEKIEGLGYSVSIDEDTCEIYRTPEIKEFKSIFFDGNGDKKQATYQAVVEFIKWYNENK